MDLNATQTVALVASRPQYKNDYNGAQKRTLNLVVSFCGDSLLILIMLKAFKRLHYPVDIIAQCVRLYLEPA
jgi:hypothetical protein